MCSNSCLDGNIIVTLGDNYSLKGMYMILDLDFLQFYTDKPYIVVCICKSHFCEHVIKTHLLAPNYLFYLSTKPYCLSQCCINTGVDDP